MCGWSERQRDDEIISQLNDYVSLRECDLGFRHCKIINT